MTGSEVEESLTVPKHAAFIGFGVRHQNPRSTFFFLVCTSKLPLWLTPYALVHREQSIFRGSQVPYQD